MAVEVSVLTATVSQLKGIQSGFSSTIVMSSSSFPVAMVVVVFVI